METLKLILLVENVLCIYRNYCLLGKHLNLVFVRILFEVSVLIASVVYYHKCSDSISVDKFYYTISYLSSPFIIFISAFYSEEFVKITRQHSAFDSYFPDDVIYKQKIKSRKKIVYSFLLVYNVFCLSTYTLYYLDLSVDEIFEKGCTTKVFYILEIVIYFCDNRFIIEIPIISVFYFAMTDQLDTISRSLKVEIKDLKKFKKEHVFNDIYYTRFSKGNVFDHWSAAYTIVQKNSKLCRNVFGFQITILIVLMVTFYVLLLNGMVILTIMGDFPPLMQLMYVFSLLEFVAALFTLSRAAQGANNSARTLRRQLSTLLVHSLGCKKQYKATRDFLRQVCTHPIETTAFGCIDVDMTLVPTCIAFCTSYTVIALQFNNIL